MKTTILLVATFLLCVSMPGLGTAGAQTRKRTAAEARAEFARADKALNEAYEAARKKLTTYWFQQLREEQRIWLGFREDLAMTPSYSGVPDHEDGEAGSAADVAFAKQSAEYFHALVDITNERIAWIKNNWNEETNAEERESLTAVWRDRQCGVLEVVQQGNKLHFIFNVVRGQSMHLGQMTGTAEWNQPIGWFSDRGRRDSEQDEVTNLAFIFRNRNGLEVVGANTRHYSGNRAYFDGHYIKVGKLDDAGKARVVEAAATGKVPEEPVPSPEG